MNGSDLRLSLLERDAIVALVDTGDHVACFDVLVVGDWSDCDIDGDFWRDGELPRGDEGVVPTPRAPESG